MESRSHTILVAALDLIERNKMDALRREELAAQSENDDTPYWQSRRRWLRSRSKGDKTEKESNKTSSKWRRPTKREVSDECIQTEITLQEDEMNDTLSELKSLRKTMSRRGDEDDRRLKKDSSKSLRESRSKRSSQDLEVSTSLSKRKHSSHRSVEDRKRSLNDKELRVSTMNMDKSIPRRVTSREKLNLRRDVRQLKSDTEKSKLAMYKFAGQHKDTTREFAKRAEALKKIKPKRESDVELFGRLVKKVDILHERARHTKSKMEKVSSELAALESCIFDIDKRIDYMYMKHPPPRTVSDESQSVVASASTSADEPSKHSRTKEGKHRSKSYSTGAKRKSHKLSAYELVESHPNDSKNKVTNSPTTIKEREPKPPFLASNVPDKYSVVSQNPPRKKHRKTEQKQTTEQKQQDLYEVKREVPKKPEPAIIVCSTDLPNTNTIAPVSSVQTPVAKATVDKKSATVENHLGHEIIETQPSTEQVVQIKTKAETLDCQIIESPQSSEQTLWIKSNDTLEDHKIIESAQSSVHSVATKSSGSEGSAFLLTEVGNRGAGKSSSSASPTQVYVTMSSPKQPEHCVILEAKPRAAAQSGGKQEPVKARNVSPLRNIATKRNASPEKSVASKSDVSSATSATKHVSPDRNVTVQRNVSPERSGTAQRNVSPEGNVKAYGSASHERNVKAQSDVSPATKVALQRNLSPVRKATSRKTSNGNNVTAQSSVSQATKVALQREVPERNVTAQSSVSQATKVALQRNASPERNITAQINTSPVRNVTKQRKVSPERTVPSERNVLTERNVTAKRIASPGRSSASQRNVSTSPVRNVSAQSSVSEATKVTLQGNISPKRTASPERNVSPESNASPERNVNDTERIASPGRGSTSQRNVSTSPERNVSPENNVNDTERIASPGRGSASQRNVSTSPVRNVSAQSSVSQATKVALQGNISPKRTASPERNVSPERTVSHERNASPEINVSPERNVKDTKRIESLDRGSTSHRNVSTSPVRNVAAQSSVSQASKVALQENTSPKINVTAQRDPPVEEIEVNRINKPSTSRATEVANQSQSMAAERVSTRSVLKDKTSSISTRHTPSVTGRKAAARNRPRLVSKRSSAKPSVPGKMKPPINGRVRENEVSKRSAEEETLLAALRKIDGLGNSTVPRIFAHGKARSGTGAEFKGNIPSTYRYPSKEDKLAREILENATTEEVNRTNDAVPNQQKTSTYQMMDSNEASILQQVPAVPYPLISLRAETSDYTSNNGAPRKKLVGVPESRRVSPVRIKVESKRDASPRPELVAKPQEKTRSRSVVGESEKPPKLVSKQPPVDVVVQTKEEASTSNQIARENENQPKDETRTSVSVTDVRNEDAQSSESVIAGTNQQEGMSCPMPVIDETREQSQEDMSSCNSDKGRHRDPPSGRRVSGEAVKTLFSEAPTPRPSNSESEKLSYIKQPFSKPVFAGKAVNPEVAASSRISAANSIEIKSTKLGQSSQNRSANRFNPINRANTSNTSTLQGNKDLKSRIGPARGINARRVCTPTEHRRSPKSASSTNNELDIFEKRAQGFWPSRSDSAKKPGSAHSSQSGRGGLRVDLSVLKKSTPRPPGKPIVPGVNPPRPLGRQYIYKPVPRVEQLQTDQRQSQEQAQLRSEIRGKTVSATIQKLAEKDKSNIHLRK